MPRHQIVEAFLPGERSHVLGSPTLAAEYLGLSPKGVELVSGTDPAKLWVQWGFETEVQPDGETWLDKIATVQEFLRRSRLEYRELLGLLQTKYINSAKSLQIVSTDADRPDTCETRDLKVHGLNASVAICVEAELGHDEHVIALAKIAFVLIADALRLVILSWRPNRLLTAENLFLRQQLGLYKERRVKPRRIDCGTPVSRTLPAKLHDQMYLDEAPIRRVAFFLVVWDKADSGPALGAWKTRLAPWSEATCCPKLRGKYLILLMRVVAFWCIFLARITRVRPLISKQKTAFYLGYNTQTKRLTPEMFQDVFAAISQRLNAA